MQYHHQNKLIKYFLFLNIAIDLCQLHHIIPGMKYLKLGILTQLSLMFFNIAYFYSYQGDKKIIILRFLFILVVISGLFWGQDPGRTMLIVKSDIPRYFSGLIGICLFLNRIDDFNNIMKMLNISAFLISIYVIMHNGHGPGGMLYDENDVGAFLVMLIPIPYYLYSTYENMWKKNFNVFIIIIIFIAIVSTMSRGAMVGTIPILFIIWIKSKNKLLSTFLLSILFVSVILFAPPKFISEFISISDVTENTAADRLYYWKLSWLIFLEKPLLGVGALGWAHAIWFGLVPYDLSVTNITPHSLYFQLISEVGIIGTVIYVSIIYITIKNLIFLNYKNLNKNFINYKKNLEVKKNEKLDRTANLYSIYSSTFLISIIGFGVCSIFISTLFYPPIHFLVFFVVALKNSWKQYFSNYLEENYDDSIEDF